MWHYGTGGMGVGGDVCMFKQIKHIDHCTLSSPESYQHSVVGPISSQTLAIDSRVDLWCVIVPGN